MISVTQGREFNHQRCQFQITWFLSEKKDNLNVRKLQNLRHFRKMIVYVNFYKQTISEIFYQIWQTGHITSRHRWGLMSALMQEDSLSEDERDAIDRLLHAVRRGWLQIED